MKKATDSSHCVWALGSKRRILMYTCLRDYPPTFSRAVFLDNIETLHATLLVYLEILKRLKI